MQIANERYTLTSELGRGGMAVVYRARDTRHDRDVAVKLMLPSIAATIGEERFLREIGTAARLTGARGPRRARGLPLPMHALV